MHAGDDDGLWLRMSELESAFRVIKTLCELADTGDSESDDILYGIGIVCDASAREAAEIMEQILRLTRGEELRRDPPPQRPADAASSGDGGASHPSDSGPAGAACAPYQVRGRAWTLDRLLLWADVMDRYLKCDIDSGPFDQWRAEIADACPGIKTTDSWAALRAKLTRHWALLGTSYARDQWTRGWYQRHLAPRPGGWPIADE